MASLFNKLTGKGNDNTSSNSQSSSSTTSHSSGSMSSSSSSSMGTNSSGSMARTSPAVGVTGTTNTTANQYGNAGDTAYNSQVGTNDAMTRSEEQLRVGKEQVNAGHAALDKYVTSEHVQTTVPVTKERVVIEREPITDANRDAALSGVGITEAHHEVNLTEERAIAAKETVPIERIRLGKQTEVHQQAVGAELRKEHIDLTTTGVNERFDNIGYGKTTGTPMDSTTTSNNMAGTTTAPRS